MLKNIIIVGLIILLPTIRSSAQTLNFEGTDFEISNVKASVINFEGVNVMKVERDLTKIPFDTKQLEKTVDEPTFVKIKDFNFENGSIEVKVYSQIQDPSPFEFAQGFIGLAF